MNLQPTYYHLLRAAMDAANAVDRFDLRSEDPASKAEWEKRLARSREAQGALVDFIIENGHELTTDIHEGFV